MGQPLHPCARSCHIQNLLKISTGTSVTSPKEPAAIIITTNLQRRQIEEVSDYEWKRESQASVRLLGILPSTRHNWAKIHRTQVACHTGHSTTPSKALTQIWNRIPPLLLPSFASLQDPLKTEDGRGPLKGKQTGMLQGAGRKSNSFKGYFLNRARHGARQTLNRINQTGVRRDHIYMTITVPHN